MGRPGLGSKDALDGGVARVKRSRRRERDSVGESKLWDAEGASMHREAEHIIASKGVFEPFQRIAANKREPRDLDGRRRAP